MKPLTREWVAKAEGDWNTALRDIRARKSPNLDAACFHLQQCAEKYLKARLQEASIRFKKTHDLALLLSLLLAAEPAWATLKPSLEVLTDCAVRFRYPGESADRETAREALRHCRLVRETVRRALKLKD